MTHMAKVLLAEMNAQLEKCDFLGVWCAEEGVCFGIRLAAMPECGWGWKGKQITICPLWHAEHVRVPCSVVTQLH